MERIYKVGDEVLLSSKYIRLRKTSKKLTDKFFRPFKVKEAIGKNVYKLDLLLSYRRIHPTFHVALLEPYYRREGVDPPELIEIDGEEEFEVE